MFAIINRHFSDRIFHRSIIAPRSLFLEEEPVVFGGYQPDLDHSRAIVPVWRFFLVGELESHFFRVFLRLYRFYSPFLCVDGHGRIPRIFDFFQTPLAGEDFAGQDVSKQFL